MKLSLLITLTLTLTLLAASCGNPHISSTRDPNLETTNPPSTPEGESSGRTTSGQTTGGISGGTTGSTTSGSTGTVSGGTVGGTTSSGTSGSTTSGTSGTTASGSTSGGYTTGGTTSSGTTGGSSTTGSTTGGGTTGGQTCVPGHVDVRDHQFYFGSNSAGQLGTVPSQFLEFAKCKKSVTETFNSFQDGFTRLVTNHSTQDFSYELIHQTELAFANGKAVYLDDVFGGNSYSMEIEKPVSQNGATGKDRGVDSHSANNYTKDSLVWSFSRPVSFWGAKVVDVESSVKEPATLRLYDCARILLKEVPVTYPNNEQGQKELHFIGFISARKNICHVSLTVGDYVKPNHWTSRAGFRALAVDEFSYGE